jgi:hypothetical protein
MERLWGARGERWNGEEAQFNSRRTSYAFDEGGLEPCRRDDTITGIHHEASTSMREPIRIEFLLDVPLPPHTTTPSKTRLSEKQTNATYQNTLPNSITDSTFHRNPIPAQPKCTKVHLALLCMHSTFHSRFPNTFPSRGYMSRENPSTMVLSFQAKKAMSQ